MRHRRAPSAMSFVPYEDTLESPTAEILDNFPNAFQLPSKDLNGNGKDIMSFILKNFSNNSENSDRGKSENSDNTLNSSAQRIQICEKIEIFSEAETENRLDELNEMVSKIKNTEKLRKSKLESKRKELKNKLSQIWNKTIASDSEDKFRGLDSQMEFWPGRVDNGVLVKFEENIDLPPRPRKKSVKFKDF